MIQVNLCTACTKHGQRLPGVGKKRRPQPRFLYGLLIMQPAGLMDFSLDASVFGLIPNSGRTLLDKFGLTPLCLAAPLEFNLAEPTPPRLEPGIAAHVILIQHQREDWVTSLVTLFDAVDHAEPVPFFRRAVTTIEHIYLEHLIVTMGYADSCLLRPSQFLCRGWYHGQALLPGRPIPGHSGYSIVVHVQRTPVFAGATALMSNPNKLKATPVQLQAHQLQIATEHFLNQLQLFPDPDLQDSNLVENLSTTAAPLIRILHDRHSICP